MKRILITGSRGFVGKALTNFLTEKNLEFFCTNIDLCNWNSVKETQQADIIIHLASKNFVPESFEKPHLYYQNNITSTLNVLEIAKIWKAKLIFFSTYVYGTPQYLPINEEHPITPLNPYTQSKVIGEELCEAYFRDFRVPITIFRPFNIFGPDQNKSFFIPTIISQLDNEYINLNDPRPKRDFIYIDDVINAIWLAVNNIEPNLNIYNLGTGVSTSVCDLVNSIIDIFDSKAKANFSNNIRQGEVLETIADISKIQKELGWSPKYTLLEGINIIKKKLIHSHH